MDTNENPGPDDTRANRGAKPLPARITAHIIGNAYPNLAAAALRRVGQDTDRERLWAVVLGKV